MSSPNSSRTRYAPDVRRLVESGNPRIICGILQLSPYSGDCPEAIILRFVHIAHGFIWLINWGLTPFSTICQSYHGGHFNYSCVSWFSRTSARHNILSKQLAAFSHRLSPLVKKTNDACHIDFCQMSA